MSIGLFTDKTHQPTEAEVRAAIGSRFPLWEALIAYVNESYPTQDDFKFLYGATYGWALRFRSKGKLLTSLYPTQGGFTAQINLRPEAIEKVRQIQVGTAVHEAIARATAYPEGRWLFIPVKTKRDLDDIQKLLLLRQAPKNKRK